VIGVRECSRVDRVLGGAYLVTAAAGVGVAGAEAGHVAAVAIAGALVGLPVVTVGVWSLAHHLVVTADSRDGAE